KHRRQLQKHSIQVVNKVDGIDPDPASADIWQLGVEDMYQIAAAHGRGVTALIDLALNPFAEAHKPENGVVSDLTEFED
ncbi:ribosome biogenesis GTPase Der, partial [Vibrio echinoideorum]